MKFRFAIFIVFSQVFQVSALAQTDDDLFLTAREAIRAGDRAKFERISPQLKEHDLVAYIEHWRLLLDLNKGDPTPVRAFLSRYDKSFIAEKMRSDWLKQLAKKREWRLFDEEYPALIQPDQELSCYALLRRIEKNDLSALEDALPLWTLVAEPPSSCNLVFDALVEHQRVQLDDIWARVRLQLEAGKNNAARATINYLPASQMPEKGAALAATDAPMPWLVKQDLSGGANQTKRELISLAMAKVARNDPRMAAAQLTKFQKHLEPSEKDWAWSQIAWQGAQRHIADALVWYQKAGKTPLSNEVLQWKARAALRQQQWASLQQTIESMPATIAADPTWVYWLGRALREASHVKEAQVLFEKIAGQANFYGNLADAELGQKTRVPPSTAPASKEEIARLTSDAGLQRSLALFRVDLRYEATREWNWAMRGLSDRDLLASAEIAQRARIYDRAISSADRTKVEHNYALRYLAPFSNEVREAAKNQSLDEAWVYGLMRQESRFVTRAKSSVGASGLMQLMPATAKWVAKKIGLTDYKHAQVTDPEINLLLGTSYMRLVLESLDNHPLLASAAYNAGPGRAQRWRAETPLEAAIYAETIPFAETRDYVKKVLSNAVYYAAIFEGKPQSIKDRLAPVAPKSGPAPKVDELP